MGAKTANVVNTEKKEIKGEIKFNLQLNEEQKLAKAKIIDSKISLLIGRAGCGKSTVAAQIALDLLFRGKIDRIVVTRAMIVAGNEEVGFLPGTLDEKLAPFTTPVYDCMFTVYHKAKIESLVKEGLIQVIPFAHMRGLNFSRTLVIVDEYQNATRLQTELVLTRICKGSKVILCGDEAQIDLKNKKQSALQKVKNKFMGKEDFAVIELKTSHRDPIVDVVLQIFDEIYKEEEEEIK